MSPQKRDRRLAELKRIDRWFTDRLAWWHQSPSRREMYLSLFMLLMMVVILRSMA